MMTREKHGQVYEWMSPHGRALQTTTAKSVMETPKSHDSQSRQLMAGRTDLFLQSHGGARRKRMQMATLEITKVMCLLFGRHRSIIAAPREGRTKPSKNKGFFIRRKPRVFCAYRGAATAAAAASIWHLSPKLSCLLALVHLLPVTGFWLLPLDLASKSVSVGEWTRYETTVQKQKCRKSTPNR